MSGAGSNPFVPLYYTQLTEGCGWASCDRENCRVYREQTAAALSKAIVMAAHGPAELCFYHNLETFEEMAETAVMCFNAGIEDAFEILCKEVKLFFSDPKIFSVLKALDTFPSQLRPERVIEILHSVYVAHESTAQQLSNSLKQLIQSVTTTGSKDTNSKENKAKVGILAFISLALDSLFDPRNYDFLVSILIQEIPKLVGKNKKCLIDIWKTVPSSKKLCLTQILHQFIALQYYTVDVANHSGGLYDKLQAPVVCLDMLFQASFPASSSASDKTDSLRSEAETMTHGLTHDAFYDDILNLEISLEQDLRRWLQDKKSWCEYPCVLNAASKARILQADAHHQMRSNAHRSYLVDHRSPYLVLHVSRGNIVEDCLQQLAPKSGMDFKMQLKVKFRGEDGIDEGGLAKEFFQVIMSQLFDRKFAMFTYYQEDRVYWFNGQTFEMPVKFELIGNLMGIALFNGVILNMHFPSILYKKLLDYPTSLEDLYDLDPAIAQNLEKMLACDDEMLEDIGATFGYSYEYFGEIRTVDLKPGGSTIAVTSQNVHEYVNLFTDYLLNKSVQIQFDALKRGFLKVTKGKTLKLFTAIELERAICGCNEYDFHQLERTTRYEDGFDKNHKVVKNFWIVLHDMPLEQQKKVLMFATGSDRAPVEGLQGVNLVISRMGGDIKSLPTSHTCFNHLLLPEYPTRKALEKALLLAINHATGFGLR